MSLATSRNKAATTNLCPVVRCDKIKGWRDNRPSAPNPKGQTAMKTYEVTDFDGAMETRQAASAADALADSLGCEVKDIAATLETACPGYKLEGKRITRNHKNVAIRAWKLSDDGLVVGSPMEVTVVDVEDRKARAAARRRQTSDQLCRSLWWSRFGMLPR